jgi:ATP-dependent Clp protease ATP-binding subunit ClpA
MPDPVPAPKRPSMLKQAFEEAARLDHDALGPEHFLLALLASPSAAAEALAELGVTYHRLADRLRRRRVQSDPSGRIASGEHMTLNPAGHALIGRAEGLAVASGHHPPTSEDWLLAMLYDRHHTVVEQLHHLGASQEAVLEALRRRGVRVPDEAPPAFRPWRGLRHVEVTEAELQPLVDLLLERHPPGSTWRWGVGWLDEPRRARVSTEEGIDLETLLAAARGQAST